MILKTSKFILDEIYSNRYTEEEIEYTINYLNSFLEKLNILKIKENNTERELNELEKFICIYDFVTKRNYNETEYSQDIIGAISKDSFVCMSFAKLIKLLCDEVNIPCFIKYSITSLNSSHANNEVVIKDKEGQKHLLHVDATLDCLNYESTYKEKEEQNPRINGLLLVEEDINKYRTTQQYQGCTNSIYTKLIYSSSPESLFEIPPLAQMRIEMFDLSVEEYLLDKYEELQEEIKAFSRYLDLELEPKSREDIYDMYRILLNEYKKIDTPIDSDELLDAIINTQHATAILENTEVQEQTDLLILRKIQKSIEFQLKNYTNENGKSLMFNIVNNATKK